MGRRASSAATWLLLVALLATGSAHGSETTTASLSIVAVELSTSTVVQGQRGVILRVTVKSASSAGWWSERQTNTTSPGPYQPEQRFAHTLAYDSARERVVLFGGQAPGYRYLNDTWEWDGTNWLQRQPDTWSPGPDQPSRRRAHAMTYDSARGRTVLFGGDEWVGYSNDLWEWDGVTWSQRRAKASPAGPDQPSPRFGAGLAFESMRGKCLLFGGNYGNDTWEWDGSAWLQRQADTWSPGPGQPVGLDGWVLTHDGARGRSVLVGGMEGTWEWDGSAWARVHQAPKQYGSIEEPAYRKYPAVAYDSHRGRTIMCGGDSFGALLNDTWEWDGTSWQETVPTGSAHALPARANPGVAYDAARRQVVVFGGLSGGSNDTWVYRNAPCRQASNLRVAVAFSMLSDKFSVAASPANTPTLAAGATTVLTCELGVNLDAYPGMWPVTIALAAVDGETGQALPCAPFTTSLSVTEGPPPLVSGRLRAPSRVVPGQTFEAAVEVTNRLDSTAAIASCSMAFSGAELELRPSPANPASLAAGQSATFAWTVSVAGDTPPGSVRASLALSAIFDRYGSTRLAPLGLGPSVLVGPQLALAITTMTASAAMLSQGQQGTRVQVGVSNLTTRPMCWIMRQPDSALPGVGQPLRRSYHTLAFDPTRGRAVMFGGSDAGAFEAWTPSNDTWEWDGSAWEQHRPQLSEPPEPWPAARSQHSMTCDTARGRVLLFGGYGNGTMLNDTWEWDGTHWLEAQARSDWGGTTQPYPGGSTAWVYDERRSAALLVGGGYGWMQEGKLYEWSAGGWSLIDQGRDCTPLSDRYGAHVAYDSGRSEVVHFGGWYNQGPLNDTWVRDAAGWSERQSGTTSGGPGQPSPRSLGGMAYDSARARTVLFGGEGPPSGETWHGEPLNDTWEWDGSNWSLAFRDGDPGSPPGRVGAGMVYDSVRQEVLLFGGLAPGVGALNDTWVYGRMPAVTAVSLGVRLGFGGDDTGYTVTPAPGNPTTLAAGATALLTFTVTALPAARPGTRTVTATLTASDPDSGQAVTARGSPSVAWTLQSRADLRLASAQLPAALWPGESAPATISVANAGQAAALGAALSLTYSGAALLASPAAGNPSTVAGGSTATFRYTVTAGTAATPGSRQGTLTLGFRDANSNAGTLLATRTASDLIVRSPATLEVTGLSLSRSTVGRGQTGLQVSAGLRNTASIVAGATATGLTASPLFGGGAAGYSILPSPGNATELSPGQGITLTFTIGVSSSAPVGPVTVSLSLLANDGHGGRAQVTHLAAASLFVQENAALVVEDLSVWPGTASRGQHGLTARVTLRHIGTPGISAAARDLAAALLLDGAPAGFTATPSPLNATGLSPGASAVLTFALDLAPEAASGDRTLTASVTAADDNTGSPAGITGRPAVTLRVQAPASLSIARVLAPSTLSRGQSVVVTVETANLGEAAAELTTVGLAFGSLDPAAALSGTPPARLEAGATLPFRYTVTAGSLATLGLRTATFLLEARDVNSGAATTAATSVTLTVVGPAMLEAGPLTAQASGLPRGSGCRIYLSMRNAGEAPARLTTMSVAFHESGPVARGFPALPLDLPAGGVRQLPLELAAPLTCTVGPVTADVVIAGLDLHSRLPIEAATTAWDLVTVLNHVPHSSLQAGAVDPGPWTVLLDGRQSHDGPALGLSEGDRLQYEWSVISRPAGSALTTADFFPLEPASGQAILALDRKGSYTIGLTVFDGYDRSAPATVSVTRVNSAPDAAVLPPAPGRAGSPIELRGTASDADVDDVLSYSWRLVQAPEGGAPAASRPHPNDSPVASTARFTPVAAGTYRFELVASDGTATSTPAGLELSVLGAGEGHPPLATARAGSATSGGPRWLEFDSSGSSDPDGDPLLLRAWSLTERPAGAAALTAATTAIRYEAFAPGDYRFTLSVLDSTGRSGTTSLTAHVDDVAPSADVHGARAVVLARQGAPPAIPTTLVLPLDGSASRDANRTSVSYRWTVARAPDRSLENADTTTLVAFDSRTAARPKLTFDGRLAGARLAAAGPYEFRLAVSDGLHESTGRLELAALDPLELLPVADAGPPRVVRAALKPGGGLERNLPDPRLGPDRQGDPSGLREDILLDGRNSAGPVGEPLTYAWRLVSAPPGAPASPLVAAGTACPAFVPARAGSYEFELVVATAHYSSLPDRTRVFVELAGANLPPTAIGVVRDDARGRFTSAIQPVLSFLTGERVTLDGRASTDVEAGNPGPLTYAWTQTRGPSVNLEPDGRQPVATFTASQPGRFAFELSVTDSAGAADRAEVELAVLSSTPGSVTGRIPSLSVRATSPGTEAGLDLPENGISTGAYRRPLRVRAGSTVRLEGQLGSEVTTGRFDWFWTQTGGPSVLLDTTELLDTAVRQSTTHFVPTTSRVHEFELAVHPLGEDGTRSGLFAKRRILVVADTSSSRVPETTGTVSPSVIAMSGMAAQRVVSLDARELFGHSSAQTLTFTWRQLAGPRGLIVNPFVPLTTFLAPEFPDGQEPREYLFELTADVFPPGDRSAPRHFLVTQMPAASAVPVLYPAHYTRGPSCELNSRQDGPAPWADAAVLLLAPAALLVCRRRRARGPNSPR